MPSPRFCSTGVGRAAAARLRAARNGAPRGWLAREAGTGRGDAQPDPGRAAIRGRVSCCARRRPGQGSAPDGRAIAAAAGRHEQCDPSYASRHPRRWGGRQVRVLTPSSPLNDLIQACLERLRGRAGMHRPNSRKGTRSLPARLPLSWLRTCHTREHGSPMRRDSCGRSKQHHFRPG